MRYSDAKSIKLEYLISYFEKVVLVISRLLHKEVVGTENLLSREQEEVSINNLRQNLNTVGEGQEL